MLYALCLMSYVVCRMYRLRITLTCHHPSPLFHCSLCDAARPPEAPSEADVITRVLAQYPDSCSASCVDEESGEMLGAGCWVLTRLSYTDLYSHIPVYCPILSYAFLFYCRTLSHTDTSYTLLFRLCSPALLANSPLHLLPLPRSARVPPPQQDKHRLIRLYIFAHNTKKSSPHMRFYPKYAVFAPLYNMRESWK
jgi:hypothetical protein